MFNTEKNVINVHEEDKTFIRALVSLSPEKKTLVKGILIGMNLQERQESVGEYNQQVEARQLTIMEYNNKNSMPAKKMADSTPEPAIETIFSF